jgi:hypothetical protein
VLIAVLSHKYLLPNCALAIDILYDIPEAGDLSSRVAIGLLGQTGLEEFRGFLYVLDKILEVGVVNVKRFLE